MENLIELKSLLDEYVRLGWSVQDQIGTVIEDGAAGCNKNALAMMESWLEDLVSFLGEMDCSDRLEELLSESEEILEEVRESIAS